MTIDHGGILMKRAYMTALVLLLVGLCAAVSGFAAPLLAQGPNTPPPTLRAYTHIFIAYAVGWLLLLGWVLRIAKKLKNG